MKTTVDILFEDESLIAVYKPAGMLSIPDRYKPDLPNLQKWLEERYETIFTVHRLDKGTSGVLCFAKTAEAHRSLSLQFENRTVRKIYHAITDGFPPEESGTIDRPLAAHPGKPGLMVVHAKGKPSVTHYQVLKRYRNHALLSLELETGRTHQIRVHLAEIGCPLLVDPQYGKQEAFFLSSVKARRCQPNRRQEERPLMDRLTLHAAELTIVHPETQENKTFKAPYPKDFRAVLNQLDKWGL